MEKFFVCEASIIMDWIWLFPLGSVGYVAVLLWLVRMETRRRDG
jgi:hypothetical protein